MQRIRLSNNEKHLLRNIAQGVSYRPDSMSEAAVAAAADSLQRKGLIKASFASGHELVAAELTHTGVMYLQENPLLLNPINWSAVAAIGACIAALAAIAALFIACAGN